MQATFSLPTQQFDFEFETSVAAIESSHEGSPVAALSAALGIPLLEIDLFTGSVLSSTQRQPLTHISDLVCRTVADAREGGTLVCGDVQYVWLKWHSDGSPRHVLGYALTRPGARPADLVVAGVESGWARSAIENWIDGIPYCEPRLLERLVQSVQTTFNHNLASGSAGHVVKAHRDTSHATTHDTAAHAAPTAYTPACDAEVEYAFGAIPGTPTVSSPDAEVSTCRKSRSTSVELSLRSEAGVDEINLAFVRSLVSSLDAKDTYTRGHSERVALIGRRLAQAMQLPEQEAANIYLSGLLHDIGKIGVDDIILRKPDKLSDTEYDVIKKHPVIGYQILSGLEGLKPILPGVRNHHEHFDGSGYPDKLAGETIPLMARILAVADAFDAMGSDRPYRLGMPLGKVESILRKEAGRQWDPLVIDVYFSIRDEIASMLLQYERGELDEESPRAADGESRTAASALSTLDLTTQLVNVASRLA